MTKRIIEPITRSVLIRRLTLLMGGIGAMDKRSVAVVRAELALLINQIQANGVYDLQAAKGLPQRKYQGAKS